LPWDPGVYDQVTDRAHRIGQKKTVVVIDILAAGTIEYNIRNMIFQKRKTRDFLVDNEDIPIEEVEKRVYAVTKENIKELLK